MAVNVPVEINLHQQSSYLTLKYENESFDFVLSQFGHMFAPRPDICITEMLRVLKPGGIIAFSTWPPELLTGRTFRLVGKYAPPPPEGVSPPVEWGEPVLVTQRLGDKELQVPGGAWDARQPDSCAHPESQRPEGLTN